MIATAIYQTADYDFANPFSTFSNLPIFSYWHFSYFDNLVPEEAQSSSWKIKSYEDWLSELILKFRS